jgi:hypothetical protein
LHISGVKLYERKALKIQGSTRMMLVCRVTRITAEQLCEAENDFGFG